MMVKRLRIFEFFMVLTNPLKVRPCARCFAEFLFELAPPQQAGHGSSGSDSGVVLPTTQAPHQKRGSARATGETPDAKRNCKQWEIDDVCQYLARLGLGHVEAKFRENAIDGEMLAELNEADMQSELGLTLLQARKVRARLPQ